MVLTERTKKILFVVFFILFSLGMGYALYLMFFRAQLPGAPQPTPEELAGQLPQAGAGKPAAGQPTPGAPGELPGAEAVPGEEVAPSGPSKIQLLHDGITQAVSAKPEGDGARFYNPEDGRFYKVTTDGTITLMGDKQFFNVDKVDWGNRTDQAIIEFPDGSNVLYDFQKKEQVTLPKHWEDFQFAPEDNRIASKSIGLDPDNRFLVVSNADGTDAKAIEALGANADRAHVAWSPDGQIIGWANTGDPQPENQEEIILVGQNHENFRSIIAPGRGFLPNWSPSGKNILYSTYNIDTANKPALWISSGDTATLGANRRPLSLNTWADKCTWASDSELYCGVPQSMPDKAGLLRSDFSTLPDDVYRVDVRAGSVTKLNLPDLTHPIKNPVLNKDRDKLIFSDAQDGKLYSYDLK